jgi:hypothetical protein
VIAFFLDKMLHPDKIVPYDTEFNKLVEDMERKGLKSLFLQYYLAMSPNVRLYYKRIKPSFEMGKSTSSVINIIPFLESEEDKKELEKKDGFIKRTLKRLLKMEGITDQEKSLLLETFSDKGELNEI